MKLYQALFVLYLAAVAVNIANGQNDNNGNDNGVYNVGTSPPHALGLHCVVRLHGSSTVCDASRGSNLVLECYNERFYSSRRDGPLLQLCCWQVRSAERPLSQR